MGKPISQRSCTENNLMMTLWKSFLCNCTHICMLIYVVLLIAFKLIETHSVINIKHCTLVNYLKLYFHSLLEAQLLSN